MTRDELVLAALASAGGNTTFTPVQVQKLFFLLDKEAHHLFNGPHFNFQPYDYGPFDRTVYDALEQLFKRGLAKIEYNGRFRIYGLTEQGFLAGSALLGQTPPHVRKYVSDVARWVKELNFEQLVASIYNRYPDMKANSVFRG